MALVCLQSWDVDVENVASCFFITENDKSTLQSVVESLNYQHIIHHNRDYYDPDGFTYPKGLGRLLNTECALLHSVLPILDFDYRLAAFLARPSRSGAVLKAELQLASFSQLELTSFFPFLAEAHTGSMWMAVGLWQHSKNIESNEAENVSDDVQISRSGVAISRAALRQVKRTYTSLFNTFQSLFYGVVVDAVCEPWDLEQHECEELQQHLAWAYLRQLTTTTRNETGAFTHELYFPPSSDASVFLPAWMNNGGRSSAFTNRYRKSGSCENHLDDWTYVPTAIIYQVGVEIGVDLEV
ncbi:hypothetical protein F53441_12306 [Fusarium austroafricanum]|uniref:Uncharacterized protein n=1 Tax=Fusarium austroafricanum TaxID=2364996 RepID=A0A8H4NPF7_9HYPO|nr:hypothetical protein F53441_12306 [Fusarium austroafricanum]